MEAPTMPLPIEALDSFPHAQRSDRALGLSCRQAEGPVALIDRLRSDR